VPHSGQNSCIVVLRDPHGWCAAWESVRARFLLSRLAEDRIDFIAALVAETLYFLALGAHWQSGIVEPTAAYSVDGAEMPNR
jgi:hypothetical protein